nr:hypothetical protein [Tanacetum cinerariifolium]
MHTAMVPEQVKTIKIQARIQVLRPRDSEDNFSFGSALEDGEVVYTTILSMVYKVFCILHVNDKLKIVQATSKFQSLLKIGMGKLIQLMHTAMVLEQVKKIKIQDGTHVSRPRELKRQLQLWKRFGRRHLIVFVIVRNIICENDVLTRTLAETQEQWPKRVKAGRNARRLGETGEGWPKPANAGRNARMLAEMGESWLNRANTGRNTRKLAETSERWPKLANAGRNARTPIKTRERRSKRANAGRNSRTPCERRAKRANAGENARTPT